MSSTNWLWAKKFDNLLVNGKLALNSCWKNNSTLGKNKMQSVELLIMQHAKASIRQLEIIIYFPSDNDYANVSHPPQYLMLKNY